MSCLPLERRSITVVEKGVKKVIPAISPVWFEERAYPRYRPPPALVDSVLPLGAVDSWLELIELLFDDLQWLLNAPFHSFWSCIILSKAPVVALISYLQEACPPYCTLDYPQKVQDVSAKLNKIVFAIYRRLAMYQESAENFMSKSYYADILYEKYIITVPNLLDLCSLYGVSNREEVEKIVTVVMDAQSCYLNDLEIAGFQLVSIFENAEKMIEEKTKKLKDVLIHVYDSVTTMRLFLEIFQKGYEVFATTQLFSSLSSFYTSVIPKIAKIEELIELVENLRIECLRYIRTILQIIVDNAVEHKSSEKVELYLSLVSEIMSDGLFICDYHTINPLDVDFDIILNVFQDIDKTKFDYLLEALASHVELKLKKKEVLKVELNHVNYPSTSIESSSTNQISGVKLLSLVTEVQDILPHLGSGFVEACLKYYDYSTERVVAAILENTLPPHLEESSWDGAGSVSHTEDLEEENVVGYKGKKPRSHRNVNQMLSDKTEINEMRDRFATLGYAEEDDYNDEYDDTYESQDIGLKEPDDAERRRPFVTPRVLEVRQRIDYDEEDEEEEEEAAVSKDQFVQNPEEVRARAEQKRMASRQWTQRDVVGKPKGQGQDKQVLQNRVKKGTNKAFTGNHNRRAGASRKRNQGMIPS